MHPLIMQIIAQQHLRDLQLEADRWRIARGVRARRHALRISRQSEATPPHGEEAA